MKVKELEPNKSVDEIVLKITALEETRVVSIGSVQGGTAKDDTGTCDITLWQDQCDQFPSGCTVKIKNGWCKEFGGKLQVSTGKFGSIEMTDGSAKDEGDCGSPKWAENESMKDSAEDTQKVDLVKEFKVNGNSKGPSVTQEEFAKEHVDPDFTKRRSEEKKITDFIEEDEDGR